MYKLFTIIFETMLQKIDKARLAKVLKVLDDRPIKPVNKTICDRLNEDPGNVSNWLSGKKAMPTNFYTNFIKAFGGPEHQENTGNETLNEDMNNPTLLVVDSPSNVSQSSLDKLIDSNHVLALANKDLSENTVLLTRMANSRAHGKSDLVALANRNVFLESLSVSLSKDGTFHTPQEAVLILDKIVNAIEKEVLKEGKKISWGR